MIRIAVLVTVFNRREITLKGLRTLKNAIANLGNEYSFDIFLTDDGSTDGTAEAVRREFSDVRIAIGNGNLFWGGGMNMAWQMAVEENVKYDYFLWYNDDSDIFPDGLKTVFEMACSKVVVTGAFKDHNGNVSYGGKTNHDQLITPNGNIQEVLKMNGNLVLIPSSVFEAIGFIDSHYIHGGGDFDYGYKVRECGFKVLLTPKYVGLADRHDEFIPKYCKKEISFSKRWTILHNPMNSPIIHFRYNMSRDGLLKAVLYFLIAYVGVFFPSLYISVKSVSKRK